MFSMRSSQVRREWSGVLDRAIREKPVFIRRTRDRAVLCSAETMAQIVGDLPLTATRFDESDNSVTLSLDAVDLVSNGATLQDAKAALAEDLVAYAEEYYQSFDLYSRAPNRKGHLPYVIRALVAKSPKELEGAIICQSGRS